MPLHIAHHKSYHPYNRDNTERVRRDEEAARRKQEAADQQRLNADAEATVDLLRAKRTGSSQGDGDSQRQTYPGADPSTSNATRESRSSHHGSVNGARHSQGETGHIDFWADMEGGRAGSSSSSRPQPDSATLMGSSGAKRLKRGHEQSQDKERKVKEAEEDASAMYLGALEKQGKPWYNDPDLRGPSERRKSADQRLEDAYKDSVRKNTHDPLKAMSDFLAQREQARRQTLMSRPQHDYVHDDTSAGPSSYRHYVSEDWGSGRPHAGGSSDRSKEQSPPRPESRKDVSKSSPRSPRRHHSRSSAEQDFRERPDVIDPGGGQGRHLGIKTEEIENELGMDRADPLMDPPIGEAKMTTSLDSTSIETPTEAGAIVPEVNAGTGTPNLTGTAMVDQAAKANVVDKEVEARSSASVYTPRESMYPTLLGEMIETVLSLEEYLFTDEEISTLRSYLTLPYEARYLFSRLIQRRDTWHRVEALRASYHSEVADMDAAVTCLSQSEEARYLVTHAQAGSDGQAELLGLLTLEELKLLAKRMQSAKPGTTKASHIAALLTTKSQGMLTSAFALSSPSRKGTKSTKSSRTGSAQGAAPKQLALNFGAQGKMASQSTRLASEVTRLLGTLVKVELSARKLIDRIALVFYRGAMLGGTALTTAVLARSRRRNYPLYNTKRSPRLFPTRSHLLAFEEATVLEAQMEELLQWGDGSEATFAKALKIFESVWPVWSETVADFSREHPDGPDRLTYHRMRFHAGWPQARIVYKGATVLARFKLHEREAEVLTALLGQRYFRRGKRGEWYDRLALITAMYMHGSNKTKAKMEALKVAVQGIEDPDTHLIYHDQLQRRIMRLENQLPIPKSQKHDFSYANLEQCVEKTYYGVRLDQMDDGRTDQTLLSPLPAGATAQRRPSGGEATGSPEGSRFQARPAMRKIIKVERPSSPFGKMQRSSSSSSLLPRAALSPSPSPSLTDGGEGLEEAALASYEVSREETRTSMASVWRGLDGQPCRVETLVLQHYTLPSEGWRGFHDEGGLLKMLFALCLWDIIFCTGTGTGSDSETAPIPDVFETPYQRAPLDLGHDSFCVTRGPLLRERLSLIAQGEAPRLVAEVDARERPRATWAVGCRWEAFTREDLLDVAACIPGQALAVVFQTMAEEWEHCSGGMPDLLLYRLAESEPKPEATADAPTAVKVEPAPEPDAQPAPRRKHAQVRMCEVKSANDRLSETQKVWIDVLLRAGIPVEVSLVREREREKALGAGRRRSLSPVKRSASAASRSGSKSPTKLAPAPAYSPSRSPARGSTPWLMCASASASATKRDEKSEDPPKLKLEE